MAFENFTLPPGVEITCMTCEHLSKIKILGKQTEPSPLVQNVNGVQGQMMNVKVVKVSLPMCKFYLMPIQMPVLECDEKVTVDEDTTVK